MMEKNRVSKRTSYIALSLVLLLGFMTILGSHDDNGTVYSTSSDYGSINYEPTTCSIEGQNEFVYKVMQDTYLWYDMVSDTDYASYSSPEELLDDIKYDELDQWSYITSIEEYNTYYEEGQYIGIGYSSKYDTNDDLRIAFVYTNSPADIANLQRGDKLIEINGMTIQEIEDDDSWSTIYGEEEIGVEVNLKIEDYNGLVEDLSLTKDWVTINPVLYYNILDSDSLKIGYLVLRSFIETASTELDTVFAYFKQENIDELILDLRYNGGGRVSVARDLASLIAGNNATNNQCFLQYIHNDKYRHCDHERNFTDMQNAINLDRVFVITTSSTCSASEAVINGLKPFIEVILIGDTTCGKPVGMYGHDFCEKHISPIEFKGSNADGEGDYFDGIVPTCSAEDDFEQSLGDTQEDSLEKALYYTANGFCDANTSLSMSMSMSLHYTRDEEPKKLQLEGFRREIGAF